MTKVALGATTRRLWGKSDRDHNTSWLPLYVHLSDAGHVAGYLWDDWLPEGTRSVIIKEFGDSRDVNARQQARQLLVFLAYVHDLGKAIPVFQSQPTTFVPGHEGESLSDDHLLALFQPTSKGGAGLTCSTGLRTNHPTHALAGQMLLDRFFKSIHFPTLASDSCHPIRRRSVRKSLISQRIRDSLTCIVGGHHGREPHRDDLKAFQDEYDILPATAETWTAGEEKQAVGQRDGCTIMGEDYSAPWCQARQSLLSWAQTNSRFNFTRLWTHPLSIQSQILLTALVIMADWIASDQSIFPLVSLQEGGRQVLQQVGQKTVMQGENPDSRSVPAALDLTTEEGLESRARMAWKAFHLESPWKDPDTLQDVNHIFKTRFNLPDSAQPRPSQKVAFTAVAKAKDPRLLIIEAPMGEGKTEAALAAAEILAKRTGRGGVCVALPTMATTDAMFSRVITWLRHLPALVNRGSDLTKTVYLAHGNASLNRQFARIAGFSQWLHQNRQDNPEITAIAEDEENERTSRLRLTTNLEETQSESDQVVASEWMWGRKKGVLSNFLICTVDQVLMASLRMKHAVLRDLALANKVVIVDECHAYDSYMRSYLKRALEWLGSCGAPVILLSATLPTSMREGYVRAYRQGYCAYKAIGMNREEAAKVFQSQTYRVPESHTALHGYPLITLLDGKSVYYTATQPASSRSVTVHVSLIGDSQDELLHQVTNLVSGGGCLGIICDTVRRAQEAYATLKSSHRFPSQEILLLHSRFTSIDRMQKENMLRKLLGPTASVTSVGGRRPLRPKRLIVVGTQVLEQSLDIDFDSLITDIAPIDLLFQRLGRVHRHHRGKQENQRPAGLRKPICKIRGIWGWDKGKPLFQPPEDSDHSRFPPEAFTGISWNTKEAKGVYSRASLYEALTVLGLTKPKGSVLLHLPSDVSAQVRCAYNPSKSGFLIPTTWVGDYQKSAQARIEHETREKNKAQGFLAASYADLSRQWKTVMDGNQRHAKANDEDMMIRAVRDTPESLTVLILQARIENGEKVVRLLPWLGGVHEGLPPVRGGMDGMIIPTGQTGCEGDSPVPKDLAKFVLQCAVTLPPSRRVSIPELTQAFEKADGQIVFGWQKDPFLSGQLPLFVNSRGQAFLSVLCENGRKMKLSFSYSRELGLQMAQEN